MMERLKIWLHRLSYIFATVITLVGMAIAWIGSMLMGLLIDDCEGVKDIWVRIGSVLTDENESNS